MQGGDEMQGERGGIGRRVRVLNIQGEGWTPQTDQSAIAILGDRTGKDS